MYQEISPHLINMLHDSLDRKVRVGVGDIQPNLAWSFRVNEATSCAHCGNMVKVLYHINYSKAKLSRVYPHDDK